MESAIGNLHIGSQGKKGGAESKVCRRASSRYLGQVLLGFGGRGEKAAALILFVEV